MIDSLLGGADTAEAAEEAGAGEAALADENPFNEVNFDIIEWPSMIEFADEDDRDLAMMPRDNTPLPPPPYSERALMPPPSYATVAPQRPPEVIELSNEATEVIELSDEALEQPPEHHFPIPLLLALYNSFNKLFVFL